MGYRPRAVKPLDVQRVSVKSWQKGVYSYDAARVPSDGLVSSGNTILEQDSVIRPRPSLSLYGTQPSGTMLGEDFEFTKVSGASSTNYRIAMINVGGTTRPYITKDSDAWSATTGKTFDNSAPAHFSQIDDKVIITNGVDTLSYFDITTAGTTNTVVPFTALSTPSAPTLTTNTGLAGATYNITYRISANSTVGETIASASLSTPVSTDRDLWSPSTQSLTIGWSAVVGAASYNVYCGTVAGYEYLIASGVSGLSFVDKGSSVSPQDTSRLYPTTDSTAGPKATRSFVINGQVFLCGILNEPRYIRYGGTGANVLDFTPANGGGVAEVGRGTKEVPVAVKPFRDGQGNFKITALCRGTNGKGKRYLLTPQTITVGTAIFSFYGVTEDNGQDGTDSPDAVILYADSIYYPSRDGFKTTGTLPQYQNILSTQRITNTIQNDVKSLNSLAMSGAVGLGFEGRLYFALPNASTTNNEIWVCDLDRGGAWMKPWNIAADWLSLYQDNNGVSHFLVRKSNAVYELSYSQLTNDNGTGFTTSGSSGILQFSKDGREWAKVIQVIFTILRPQGTMNFTVSGKTEDSSLSTVGTGTFTPGSTIAGWSEAAWGTFAWSDAKEIPVSFGDSSKDFVIEVDEELQWLQYAWATPNSGTDYRLADVIVEYVPIGIKDLT